MTSSGECRVFFVGNSYTLYHDVPAQVAGLAAHAGRTFSYETSLEGGADLGLHLSEKGAGERLRSGVFTHVVLQERSTGPLLEPRKYCRAVERFAAIAKEHDVRLVFFQTWAWGPKNEAYRWPWSKRSPEGWLATVRKAVGDLAVKHGGEVARVGEAWMTSLEEHPGIRLHDEDEHHATVAGAHLAALMLYRAIHHEAPASPGWFPPEISDDFAKKLRDSATRVVGA